MTVTFDLRKVPKHLTLDTKIWYVPCKIKNSGEFVLLNIIIIALKFELCFGNAGELATTIK